MNRLIGFLSAFLLVRILTPEDYGVYSYVFSIFSSLILLNGFGALIGMLQLCSEEEPGSPKAVSFFKYAARFGMIADLCLAVILFVASCVIVLPLGGANDLVGLIALLPFVVLSFELILIWYRSQSANKEYAKNTTVNSILLLLGTLGGAWFFGSWGAFIGYYAAYAISALIAFSGIRSVVQEGTPTLSAKEKRTLVKISLAAALTNAASSLVYLIDVLLIGALLASSVAVAEYKVATLIPSALTFISSTIMVYLFPYFARNRQDKNWCFKKYIMTTLMVACLSIFITLICVALSKPLLPLLFGEEYSAASPIFNIMMLSFLANGGFRIVAGNVLASQRKYAINLIVALVAIAIDVTFCVILIPHRGIVGAAWASFATMAATALIVNIYLIRHLKAK